MFSDTVTVYNKYRDETGAEKWSRAVVGGAHWESSRGRVARNTGEVGADAVRVFIQKAGADGYVSPLGFDGSVPGSWTLRGGDKLVRGVCGYEIERSASELSRVSDQVMTVSNVDDRDFGALRHWEVSGL